MKNFDEIKNIWSESTPDQSFSAPPFLKRKGDHLAFLRKQYLRSAIGLFCLTVFIMWFAYFSDRNFRFELSYASLTMLSTCLFIMMFINLHNAFLISRIDETATPEEYLSRWIKLYRKRFQFFRLYGPVLTLGLCLAFGLYVPEILGYYPTTAYKIGFVLFLFLLFAGYFRFGKKTIIAEKMKLNEINSIVKMLYEDNPGN